MNEPSHDRPNLVLIEYRIGVAEQSIKALVGEVDLLRTDAADVARTLAETKDKSKRRFTTLVTITTMIGGAMLTGLIELVLAVLHGSGH